MSDSVATIFYVDDDSDDIFFLKETLVLNGRKEEFVSAANGEEAIEYLKNHALQKLPDLIVLDLNMPRIDGRQTLKYIKEQENLQNIPVIVLSTSESNLDKEMCRKLGAVSYLQKPSYFEGYKEILNNIIPILEG